MHRLSDHIELIQEDIGNGQVEYLVCVDGTKYKDFVVNKITFDFMQHFIEATDLESVIDAYLQLTGAKDKEQEQVQAQLTSFFNEVIKKGWIVDTEDKNETVNHHEIYFKKGDLIDDYKILKVLANNELTDVFLVKPAGKRKKFVIKYLNPSRFKNHDRYLRYTKYFHDEYKFLQQFNSNYINKGIAFKNEPENCYMVLQHIDGLSIYKYVKNNRLTTVDKMHLVTKILRGFSLIHDNRIYHGDIHLSNVLVTQNRQVKIIDFGYSNPSTELENSNRKTRNGGVHAFIPPERALRSISRKFNAVEQYQSEVYQIGLILYYVFVRQLPFKAETWKTMVDEKKTFVIHEHEAFLKRRMPKAVKQFIGKSLEQDPGKRFENARSMLNAWKEVMK